MDDFFTILILIALAVPVGIVVALVMAGNARGRVSRLEARLSAIEMRLAQLAAPGAATAPLPEAPTAAPLAPEAAPEPVRQPVEQPEGRRDAQPPGPAAIAAPSGPPPHIESPSLAGPGRQGPGLEERFGTRWVVWIGGIALALGGIFLVRYSIEQGLLGPGVRVFLGALLAAALVAAGEWMRRRENLSGIAGLPVANIPSILTAAGTTVAYATAYAAYALYDLLPPSLAFVLLGVVALLTLAAALLHGPALAALGLIGAYLTPALIASKAPNYWALYIYLAVVTAASFGLARLRMWRWLAVSAVLFGTLWTLPGIDVSYVGMIAPHLLHVVAGFALVTLLIVAGWLLGPSAVPGRIDAVSSGALAAYLLAATALVIFSGHDGAALTGFAVLAAATLAIAWRAEAATAAVPAAALLVALVIGQWAVTVSHETLVLPAGPAAGAIPEPSSAVIGPHLAFGALFAVLFGAGAFLAQGRSVRPVVPILWAASGVLAPLAILVALYYRIASFERSIPFAGIALLLAALYAVATEFLTRREPRPGLAAASAIFTVGSIAALALAMTFALEKGWLTVALALIVPGIAYVVEKRPLPMLRWAAAADIILVLARIAWEPRIVGDNVGSTPIFNWLLWGYGIPAAGFWLAGHLLRRRQDDVPARMADSAAVLFTVLLAFLEIRHLINGGDVYRETTGLAELALEVSVALAMAIGLERVRGRTRSIVHNVAALALAALAAIAIVFGLWFSEDPFVTGESVGGGLFWNQILLGYGLPALLATALALVTRQTRPPFYRVITAVLSVGLALFYLSLEVARFYQGPELSFGPVSDAELYTYSAVWLVFGVLLLLFGIALRSQPARLASAAVVLMTIAKIFVIDLDSLEGIFRALSFIGLGLVLVGIGLLYQRLLFPPQRPPAAGPTAPSGAATPT